MQGLLDSSRSGDEDDELEILPRKIRNDEKKSTRPTFWARTVANTVAATDNLLQAFSRQPNKSKKQTIPGEEELNALMIQAEYELEQDPYRGMAPGAHTSPWQTCEWGAEPL